MEGKWKIHWVGWEMICQPVENGGLGVKKMDDFNTTLLLKWYWRILKGEKALWLKVLEAKYGNIQNFLTSSITGRNSGVNSALWKDILKLEHSSTISVMVGNFSHDLGNSDITLFWESMWLWDNSLRKLSMIFLLSAWRKGWRWERWECGTVLCGFNVIWALRTRFLTVILPTCNNNMVHRCVVQH